jgi:hypothetical protein
MSMPEPTCSQEGVRWQSSGSLTTVAVDVSPPSPLDGLVAELAVVREAGLEPLDVETELSKLLQLSALGIVRRRTRPDTSLATATSLCQVVREAADRLEDEAAPVGPPGQPSFAAQAQMLLRVHYATRSLSPADARTKTQESSGVANRQYRGRHEARLLRLVAQSLLDLDHEDDLHQWGRALEVGADVPQSVALYWLYLFRDHYFRLETSAYAFQTDTMTALSQFREDQPSWRDYLAASVYWNVEFSYLRHRFFRNHGPLWFAPTDEGCTKLNDAVERIEYHDPFPDEFMAKLRRLYGAAADPDHDDFTRRLAEAGLADFTLSKAEAWLRRCPCPKNNEGITHGDTCEVGLVLTNCDTFGDTVEEEFTRIQEWYRNPRFAVEPALKDRILGFRSPGRERDTAGPSADK